MTLVIAIEPISLETDADGVVCVGGTRVTMDTIVAADAAFIWRTFQATRLSRGHAVRARPITA